MTPLMKFFGTIKKLLNMFKIMDMSYSKTEELFTVVRFDEFGSTRRKINAISTNHYN